MYLRVLADVLTVGTRGLQILHCLTTIDAGRSDPSQRPHNTPCVCHNNLRPASRWMRPAPCTKAGFALGASCMAFSLYNSGCDALDASLHFARLDMYWMRSLMSTQRRPRRSVTRLAFSHWCCQRQRQKNFDVNVKRRPIAGCQKLVQTILLRRQKIKLTPSPL